MGGSKSQWLGYQGVTLRGPVMGGEHDRREARHGLAPEARKFKGLPGGGKPELREWALPRELRLRT